MSVWIPPTYAIIFDFFPVNLFFVNLILIFSPARRNFEGDRMERGLHRGGGLFTGQ